MPIKILVPFAASVDSDKAPQNVQPDVFDLHWPLC